MINKNFNNRLQAIMNQEGRDEKNPRPPTSTVDNKKKFLHSSPFLCERHKRKKNIFLSRNEN